MSPLALWFKLHSSKPLAVLTAEARSNGHTKEAIASALSEYHLSAD